MPRTTTLTYLVSTSSTQRLGDHASTTLSASPGSASLAVDASTSEEVETRYREAPRRDTFTGQYSDSYINLLDYGSRRYDPELGRFLSPDTIVPTSTQGTQAWDRYAFVNNNPVRYTDPTGHVGQNTTDSCGPDGMYCDPTDDSFINWDPAFSGGLSSDDRAEAEKAYLHYLRDPAYFINLYLNPQAWENSVEARYLDVYSQYSTFELTAEELLLLNFADPEAAKMARLSIGAGEYETASEHLALALGIVGGAGPSMIGGSGAASLQQRYPGLQVGQIRMPGGVRVYDGWDPLTGNYLEIKTTTRGVYYPNNASIRQLAFDYGGNVYYIFVGGPPSVSYTRMLKASGIPWVVIP